MISTDLIKISDNQGSTCGDSSRSNVCSSETDSSIESCVLSSAGNKCFIPSYGDTTSKPYLNQIFDSLDKAYKFYKEYGRLGGFDIRRAADRRFGDGTVQLKHFVCSCEGFNKVNGRLLDPSDEKNGKERKTASRRCGCNARMILKYKSRNRYFVFKFVEQHNHPLASEEGRKFLRASREVGISSRSFIFAAAKANIGSSKAFNLMKEMVGGYSNVGATLRDFRNCERDLKVFVGERDSQMMIDKFKVIKETSNSFYFAYDVDDAGHLTKLFWCDVVGQRNFELYGDAVSFDATFDTNKYNMIFAPFTGVDKHDRCVTFAACLLSKEDIIHYSWAFDHLVKVMGRNPVVVVTDQCPAMRVAVPTVFNSNNGLVASKHRLCMWHIMQKFPVKLGNRLCKETDFLEKMKTYIWASHLDVSDFEQGWEAVVKEFKLEGNKWLCDLYDLRESWIPAYFRDEPMFGLMRTTSRSESEIFFFGQFHKQGDTLCEFWLRFESAMERQRNETARLNHESNSSVPNTLTRWFIEDDAAEIFTRSISYKVQEEIIASCLDMQIKRMSEEVAGVTSFEIRDVKIKDKLFKVSVSRNHAVCSCKKFVMCGIVCRHAFCGLKQIGVTKFPKSLVLNRWIKMAETGSSCSTVSLSSDYFKMEQVSLKLTNIWFDFRQTVNKAGTDLDMLDIVHETIKHVNTDLDSRGKGVEFTKTKHMAALVGEPPVGQIEILAPKVSKNKGNYFKRLISDREKAITKAKKRVRKCKKCEATTHDSRTCPKKNGGSIENIVV